MPVITGYRRSDGVMVRSYFRGATLSKFKALRGRGVLDDAIVGLRVGRSQKAFFRRSAQHHYSRRPRRRA